MSDDIEIRIVRSANRRKTISARLVDGGAAIEVLAPAAATDAELAPFIEQLKGAPLAPQGQSRDGR